jgi:pimeloyl-ACP methyl ester carboxylesterase
MEDITMTTITNTVNAPSRAWRIGRRLVRGVGRALGALIGLIAILALAGASYESLAAGGDARRYPPPGQLVDVGGYRMHLYCIGAGSPTVVFESGLGGSSLDWNLVQPELGGTTRVCAYDRAGYGWSDPSPQPRTPRQIAGELHQLLINAGIAGPYVLVGHSLGGKYVRLFALDHPDQVVGMVLVDARHEYVDFNVPTTDLAAEEQVVQAQRRIAWVTGRSGIARLLGARLLPALAPGAQALSAETRTQIAIFTTRQKAIDSNTSELTARAADDQQLRAAALGGRPLLVLAAGQSMAQFPIWQAAQQQQATLSSNGRLIIAERSGHYIQWDQPALVIDAVRQVIAAADHRQSLH